MSAVIWVKLEVTGDDDEVMDVVDSVLDNGDFQDAIMEYATDNDKDVRVTSALAHFDPRALGYDPSDPSLLSKVGEVHRAECAECRQEVDFDQDGQPLSHDDGRTGRRCDASPLETS